MSNMWRVRTLASQLALRMFGVDEVEVLATGQTAEECGRQALAEARQYFGNEGELQVVRIRPEHVKDARTLAYRVKIRCVRNGDAS